MVGQEDDNLSRISIPLTIEGEWDDRGDGAWADGGDWVWTDGGDGGKVPEEVLIKEVFEKNDVIFLEVYK